MLSLFLLLEPNTWYVFLMLAIIAGIAFGLRSTALWYFERQENLNIAESDAEFEEDDDDELVGILTAAAFSALKKPVRIQRIRLFENTGTSSWAATGRLNIMASHLITKRK